MGWLELQQKEEKVFRGYLVYFLILIRQDVQRREQNFRGFKFFDKVIYSRVVEELLVFWYYDFYEDVFLICIVFLQLFWTVASVLGVEYLQWFWFVGWMFFMWSFTASLVVRFNRISFFCRRSRYSWAGKFVFQVFASFIKLFFEDEKFQLKFCLLGSLQSLTLQGMISLVFIIRIRFFVGIFITRFR